jgi:GAF domain-containing protein
MNRIMVNGNKTLQQESKMEETTKIRHYQELRVQLSHVFEGERDAIANMANFTSFLFYNLNRLNWAGFYLMRDDELVLGPFQGKPACIRIAMGKGVCGTAAQTRKAQVVPNVHDFPGHIPCDSASNSEIVLPVLLEGRLFGVLDLDSPDFSRFDEADRAGLEKLLEILIAHSDLIRFMESTTKV